MSVVMANEELEDWAENRVRRDFPSVSKWGMAWNSDVRDALAAAYMRGYVKGLEDANKSWETFRRTGKVSV